MSFQSPGWPRPYGKALKYFFDYLVNEGAPDRPAGLGRAHLDQYVAWLKAGRGPGSAASQRNAYSHTKAVLHGLIDRFVIGSHDGLFPANPLRLPPEYFCS